MNWEGVICCRLQYRCRGTTLPNRAHQSLLQTWIETVSGSPTSPWIHDLDLSVSEHTLTCHVKSNKASRSFTHLSTSAKVRLKIGMKRVCLLGPVNTSPGLTLKMCMPASPRSAGFWDSGGRVTRPTCEDAAALVCLLLPFDPLIHSGRIVWMISFTFLVQVTQEFLDILLGLSVHPCLIGRCVMANPPCCEDRSRTHDACNASSFKASRSTYFRSRSIPSPSSSPPTHRISPSHPSIDRAPLPTHACPISTLAWRQLRWITHTYAIIHVHPLH